jgi:hypothetical protein
MKNRATLLLFGFALAAFGQTAGGGGGRISATTTTSGTFTSIVTSVPSMAPMAAIAGAQYSAEQVQERVQTLSDGTHITETQPVVRYFRDSQGRMRVERALMAVANGAEPPTMVEITDPVAGAHYTLEPGNKVAHKWTTANEPHLMPPPPPPPPPPGAGAGSPSVIVGRLGAPAGFVGPSVAPANRQGVQPEIASQDLGTQVMEGVTVQGTRRTITWPVGSMGNDRPLVTSTETWTSPELKAIVLSKTNDPRSGESTVRLTNISRNEPDPALFRPPADYSVVDESANAIRFSRQQ